MADEYVVKVKLETDASSVQKAADTFENRIKSGLQNAVSKLGIGKIPTGANLGSTAGVSTTTGAGAGIDAKAMTGAVSEGMVAGLAAGGLIGVLNMVVDLLKDMPIITAIMKILKLILMILFLPLVPILKPVLLLLAGLAKLLAAVFGGAAKVIDFLMPVIMPVIYAFGLFGKGLGLMAELVGKVFNLIMDGLNAGLAIVKDIGKWIWEQIIKPGFNYLLDVGKVIWDTILKPAFNYLINIGSKIWSTILKPAFNFLSDVGSKIWTTMIKPGFSVLSNLGKWIWDIIKSPFVWLANAIIDMYNWVAKSLVGKAIGMKTVKNVSDAIITPSGIVKTDPSDFIIATKNPNNFGGKSMVVNINIDKPTVSNQADIKTLVKAIEQELYKTQRRYNSYV